MSSPSQRLDRLKDNLGDNYSQNYIGKDLEPTDKEPSEVDCKEIILKIDELIIDFIAQADLYLENTKKQLLDLKNRLQNGKWYRLNRIVCRLLSIDLALDYIRDNQTPREFIKLCSKSTDPKEPALPSDALYATIVIDDSLSDQLSKTACLDAISDRTPLILTSRTYASILPNEDIERDFWVFQHSSKFLVVCYPKESNKEPLQVLTERGFDISKLSLLSDVECFKEMDYNQFVQNIAEEIPTLFSYHPIPKRFHIVGHGSPTSKLANPNDDGPRAWYAGLRIPQFQNVLQRLQDKGMDYVNCVSCFSASLNLIEVFHHFPRRFTVTVCNINDVCPTYDFNIPGEAYIRVQLHRTAQFWNKISATLCKEGEALKPKDFRSALERIYGCNWAAIPLVSVIGSKHFTVVNVHKRSVVITYKKLAKMKPLIESKKECLLVYPQVLEVPIKLDKNLNTGRYPNVISMIHDHNQILFSKIVTSDPSPLRFIRESFLKESLTEEYLHRSKANHLYVVREFAGTVYTFINVIACFNYDSNYCIFQKANEPGKWFLFAGKEREISHNEALVLLHQNLQRINTSKEGIEFSSIDQPFPPQSIEEVRKCYQSWFGVSSGNSIIFQALELIDRGEFSKIPSHLKSEDYLNLMFYCVYDKKWPALLFLSNKTSDFEGMNCFGKKLLHLMIENGCPIEVMAQLLLVGASTTSLDSEGLAPLNYAIKTKREDVIELLIGHGADVNAPVFQGFVNFAFNDDNIDLAMILVKKFKAKVFGGGILLNASIHPSWEEFYKEGLAQLKLASNGDETSYSQKFLQMMLIEERGFIDSNSWQFLSPDCRRSLTDSFVKAFSVLSQASCDISSLSQVFLKIEWSIHRDDFETIKKSLNLSTN